MNAIEVMQAFAGNFPGIQTALFQAAYGIGFLLGGYGLYELAFYSRMRQQGKSAMSGLFRSLAGSAMLSYTYTMQVFSQTVFGTDEGLRTALSYTSVSGSNQAAAMLTVLFGLITIYGWYGGLRGLFILSRLGENSTSHSALDAGVRIAFGAICANALYMTDVLANTFHVENWIRNYIS